MKDEFYKSFGTGMILGILICILICAFVQLLFCNFINKELTSIRIDINEIANQLEIDLSD